LSSSITSIDGKNAASFSPDPAWIPSSQAARYIGIAPKTLANWRSAGEGPPYARLGRSHSRVIYRISDLHTYLEERIVGGAA
jgi:hypothetical protein